MQCLHPDNPDTHSESLQAIKPEIYVKTFWIFVLRLSCRAVTYGYVATALICTVLGGFGYALYGSGTMPVITASLPAMSVVALMCTALTLCNPFSAFALTLEPVAMAVQQKFVGQVRGGSSELGGTNSGDVDGTEVPYPVRAAIRLGEARKGFCKRA